MALETPVDVEMRVVEPRVHERLFGAASRSVSIGRFTVIGSLGAGGSGAAFTAHDPELDRKVTIELIAATDTDAAQAMARLSHPNLVAVHEVGMHEGRAYVAMDHIDGESLECWLASARRSRSEILAAFVQAGRGLAAAYRAGVVHGDFSATRALVDRDGRVRVRFGLGERDADPLHHQRAYCESLTRALTGVDVPLWMRRALGRGLAQNPAARWPSLDALLDVLEGGASRARHRIALALLVVVALACAGFVGWNRIVADRRVAACEASGDDVIALWSEERRDAVRATMLATGVAYADTTLATIEPRLDAHVDELAGLVREACMNHHARRVWDDDTFERASWCLDEGRLQLDSVLAEFERADAAIMVTAVAMVTELNRHHSCLDADTLHRRLRPSAEQVDAARAVRADLRRAWTSAQAGRIDEALDVLDVALAQAHGIGWAPLVAAVQQGQAEALEKRGAFADAERVGREAYFTAALVGDWELAADAAMWLVVTVGDRQTRFDEGLRWNRHAEIAESHAGAADPLRTSRRLAILGDLHMIAEAHEESIALHERALALRTEVLGTDHPDLANSVVLLADAATVAGDFARAQELYDRARDLVASAYGIDHPLMTVIVANLGHLHNKKGEYRLALAAFDETIARLHRTGAAEGPDMAGNLMARAVSLADLGEVERARADYEHAIAIYEESLGPEHYMLAGALYNLGNLLRHIGEREQAIALLERALAIETKALGPEHPHVALSMSSLALGYAEAGELARARALLESAHELIDTALGPAHIYSAVIAKNLGELLESQGETTRALALIERSITVYDSLAGEQESESSARFALARLLVANGGDRARALASARAAREGARRIGTIEARLLASIESWIAEMEAEP